MASLRFRALGALMAIEAATFALGAALHAGARISLGFTDLDEPRIIPATIVESACGLALAIGAFGLLSGRAWGRPAALAAHVVALAGITLGMIAVAAGGGTSTELNDAYHRAMVGTLLLGLTLLVYPTTGLPAAPGDDRTVAGNA
jgi:hypothetical protein